MSQYNLPPLPFAYDALEPFIDAATMRVHHGGHHKAYVDKLNAALKEYPDLQKPVEELLASLNTLPIEIRTAVANNAGGHANHTLFWTLLEKPKQARPSTELSEAIGSQFGSFEDFRTELSRLATEHFSNGWAWLCIDSKERMSVFTSKDHESPISKGLTPLLVLDLWEHAYYLKYKNQRAQYVEAFWNVVRWSEVEGRWRDFLEKGGTSREWRIAG